MDDQRINHQDSGFEEDKRKRWARRAASVTAPVFGIVEGILFRTHAVKVFGKLLVIAVLVALMGAVMAVVAMFIASSVPTVTTSQAFFALCAVVVFFFVSMIVGGVRRMR